MTLGLVAFIVAASRRDGRRLGDVAAGTVALSVRVGTAPARRLDVAAPPALLGWVATVDPSGLDQPRRVALRRYHERADGMRTDAREVVATSLAQRLVADLGLTWPAPASAHDVLCAIAAAAARVPPPTRPPTMPPSTPSAAAPRPPPAPAREAPPPGGFRPPE